jgi:hypothetical protein
VLILKFVLKRKKDKKQILRLTTPKLKDVWGPFAQNDSRCLVMKVGDKTRLIQMVTRIELDE